MLATKSSNGALKRLHECDLFWIIHVEPHGLLNEDRVAKLLGPLTSEPILVAFSMSARSLSYCSLVQYSEAAAGFERSDKPKNIAGTATALLRAITIDLHSDCNKVGTRILDGSRHFRRSNGNCSPSLHL